MHFISSIEVYNPNLQSNLLLIFQMLPRQSHIIQPKVDFSQQMFFLYFSLKNKFSRSCCAEYLCARKLTDVGFQQGQITPMFPAPEENQFNCTTGPGPSFCTIRTTITTKNGWQLEDLKLAPQFRGCQRSMCKMVSGTSENAWKQTPQMKCDRLA